MIKLYTLDSLGIYCLGFNLQQDNKGNILIQLSLGKKVHTLFIGNANLFGEEKNDIN